MTKAKAGAAGLPAYLQMVGGAVSIDFKDMPLSIDGGQVTELKMREPRVSDQLMVEGQSAMKAEVAIFGNLCELDPGSVSALTLKQYGRLQEAYASFLV